MPLTWVFCVIVLTDEQVFRLICQGKRWATCLIVGRPIFLSESVQVRPSSSKLLGRPLSLLKANYRQSVQNVHIYLQKTIFLKLLVGTN